MGSTDNPEELTVLITGYGPFKEEFPQNPSWEIASRLPTYLPPLPAKSSISRASQPLPPVRLLVHPEPIHVSYDTVRELVPRFWDGEKGYMGRKIDVALHIGMAGKMSPYSVERVGHRDGYKCPDVDGRRLEDEKRKEREGERWIWYGVPRTLETDLDLVDVLGRWKGYLPDDLQLKISDDAGRYLCDFIYFTSLAHLYKANEYRRVTFLHVPADASAEALTTGREIVLQLVRSIMESEMARKEKSGEPDV